MDRDGTGDGYDLELLRAIGEAVRVPVIASGGAGELDHFAAALTDGRRRRGPRREPLHFGQLTIAPDQGRARAPTTCR